MDTLPNVPRRFLLLPPRGTIARGSLASALTGLPRVAGSPVAATVDAASFDILDEIHENGVKLIQATEADVPKIRAAIPGVRVVPEVFYYPALAPRPTVARGLAFASARMVLPTKALFRIRDADGRPIVGATVVAFTSFANRQGDQGETDAQGEVRLAFPTVGGRLDRLYVYPRASAWSLLRRNVALQTPMDIRLEALDADTPDLLSALYPTRSPDDGRGVRVGIVDTGVGPHPDLVVADGRNTVTGEVATDFGDNGKGHGTHVAGIVAGRRRGLAPAAEIRGYRVFGAGQDGASNFAIAAAIDAAITDGCHLINMSLGGGDPDAATQSAINDAFDAGVLCFVAAGNDGRQGVSFPGSLPNAQAVSAFGRVGTFPASATEADEVEPPRVGDDFVASFSNVGTEIDLTGPGVGIVSTMFGAYAALSGTSMACPAATGVAARILGGSPLLSAPGSAQRTQDMLSAILHQARIIGFGAVYEGSGYLP